MKPPVEAPTSIASRPSSSTFSSVRAFASFSPPRETKRGGRSTASSASSAHLVPGLVVAGDEPGEHERLSLRAALRQPALDEQDVEALLHPSKGSRRGCYKTVMELRGDRVDGHRSAIDWLLESDEPGVVCAGEARPARRGRPAEAARVLEGPKVRALLAGQQADGGFGVNVYAKWAGAHWRLVSLVELGVPAGEPRCVAAAETVLAWLTGKGAPRRDRRRSTASPAAAARRRGTRSPSAAASGWRTIRASGCSRSRSSSGSGRTAAGTATRRRRATAPRSTSRSPPMWGLHEYWVATGEPAAREAADAPPSSSSSTASSGRSRPGEPIRTSFVTLHYPPFWHYDLLQALVVLARMGLAGDPRAADAVELVEERRLPDGRWRAGGRWWKPPGSKGSNVEVVDWGRSGANEMVTLNALRVLQPPPSNSLLLGAARAVRGALPAVSSGTATSSEQLTRRSVRARDGDARERVRGSARSSAECTPNGLREPQRDA